jgi:hypothetical protein
MIMQVTANTWTKNAVCQQQKTALLLKVGF